MPLVFAAIAPHGGIAIAEHCAPDQRDLAQRTRAGLEELGRRFTAAAPDVTVVLTPHHVHIEGHMAVSVSATLAGTLEGTHPVSLSVPVDRDLAIGLAGAMAAAGVPAVGVSAGANDPAAATLWMDWATLIPLWFMGGRDDPPKPAVMIAPARDLSWDHHVRAGRAITLAAERSGRRVALIASCDHGHAHDPAGPYGYAPESKEFDDRVVDIVGRNALAELLTFDAEWIARAKPDSFWQMLMLHGAIGDRWRGELLSYEAPTYFGMLCAAYRQVSCASSTTSAASTASARTPASGSA